ncbi:MAG: MFS transporter [Pseudomonadota bacterium]|nr:MFS transporter [Pseudomonadota bacterium]
MTLTNGEGPSQQPPVQGGARLAYFLGLMFLVSTLNMADRQIIGVVAEPVKEEFGLSDTMLGLVGGTAFAVVYPTLGLVIARIADRSNRRNILSACLALWSSMTLLCGIAPGFWFLVAARTGVAAGEAGYAPCTHSLIADAVPARLRARAFSVIVLGISAGGLLASVVGGLVAETFGWRAAFLVLGAPGVVVAGLIFFTIKEPPRIVSGGPRQLMTTFGTLVRSAPFMFCVAGAAFHLMVAYGLAAFAVALFVRVHGMSVGEAAVILGYAAAVAGALGSVVGGAAGDFLAKYDRRWPALTVLVAVTVGAPAFLAPGLVLGLVGAVAGVFFNGLYQPATYALVQSVADPRERASAAALMIFIQNLTGLGLGPLLVGIASDALAPAHGDRALGMALALLFLLNIPSALAFYLSGKSWKRADPAPDIA